MIGQRLQAARDRCAALPGWGPRTIGRLSTRVSLTGAVEWIACVYVAADDDQRKARHARTGLGPTADAALDHLDTRIQERSNEA